MKEKLDFRVLLDISLHRRTSVCLGKGRNLLTKVGEGKVSLVLTIFSL